MTDNSSKTTTTVTPADKDEQSKLTYPESADIKDILHKELDMIQGIITRMGANSFQCKGWLIGIFAFVMAMNKDSNLFGLWVLILIAPVLLFWYLDGFFLYVEQRYRDLYTYTVKKRTDEVYKNHAHNGKELEVKQRLYDLRYTSFEHRELIGESIRTHFKFYRKRKTIQNNPQIKLDPNKIEAVITIFTAMFSKTLRPFYLTILFFILFIASTSGVKQFFAAKETPVKEPISIQLDSTTLQLLLKNAQTLIAVPQKEETKKVQPDTVPVVEKTSPKGRKD
jgi:hypothetical protein